MRCPTAVRTNTHEMPQTQNTQHATRDTLAAAHPPVALTIAGSDSGGGAGIQADLKTFEAHGVFGASVITALTAQNTRAVEAVLAVPADFVAAQIDAVASDIRIDVVKTGMLGGPDVVEVVAAGIERHALGPVVVDPVMISKSGFALLPPEAVEAVKHRLLPLATIATPNAHEAAALAGFPVATLADARRAAGVILALGPAAVLVKGGHLADETDAVDLLLDAAGEALFRAGRIDTPHTHGTGCTYASAIAANLALGFDLREAIARAKVYLTEAIRHAIPLGSGHGPTRHAWRLFSDEG